MRRLLPLALLVLLAWPVKAAPLHAPCLQTGPSSVQCDPVNSTNPMPTTTVPSAAAGAGIAPAGTQSAASNQVLCSAACNVYSVTVTIGATAGWVMLFDATALPSNGATGASMVWCYPVNSDGTKGGIDVERARPWVMATGAVVGFSSTACNSLTASATAFFSGQKK